MEVLAAAQVHWSTDDWRTTQDTPTKDTRLGIYYVDLPTDKLPAGGKVVFTFHWLDEDRWEGKNYQVVVEKSTRRDPGTTSTHRGSKQPRSGVAEAVH